MKNIRLFILLILVLVYGCKTNTNTLIVSMTKAKGYGPFIMHQGILPDLAIIGEDTTGIIYPKKYKTISLRNFHIQKSQYLFYKYKNGKYPKSRFLDYCSINNIDTTRLSRSYVDESILIGIDRTKDSSIVALIDTDNDEDLSDESLLFYKKFDSPEEEVKAIDSLPTIKVKIEYYDGTKIIEKKIDLLINPYKGHLKLSGLLEEAPFLAVSISGYFSGTVEIKDKKYPIAVINDNLSLNYNRKNTRILLSLKPNELLQKTKSDASVYKIGDILNINGVDIKFISITSNGEKLTIQILGKNRDNIGLNISNIAPNFVWKDLSNNDFDLFSLRGKYVLLDFWGTWCTPCLKEIPNLKEAYKKFKGSNFEMVSIAIDKDAQSVKAYIGKNRMSWIHLFQALSDTSKEAPGQVFKVKRFPTTILIDPNGKIIAKDLRGEELIKILGKCLN